MSYQRTSQRVLVAIGRGHSSPAGIAADTGISPSVVRTMAAKLYHRGLADRPEHGTYTLSDAGREWISQGLVIERTGPTERRTRRTRGLRVRAWWLMRQLGRWTLADLLTTLADGSLRSPRSNLLRYIHGLESVGIVTRSKRVIPGASPFSKGHVLWLLASDVGPRAPVLRAERREVYDPNKNATHMIDEAPHV